MTEGACPHGKPPFIQTEGNMSMKKSGRILNRFVLLFGIACIAYYLGLGIAVRFGQSLQFLWLIAGLLCIGRYLYWRHVDKTGRYPNRKILRPLRAIFLVALCVFLAVQAAILAVGCAPAEPNLDYIVVLGAKVNGREPSGGLRNRIQVGIEYLSANPDTIAILSGGQGEDEEISEAQCMYERMVAAGIDPARLILEDQSTDTSENLRFSRELIPEGARVGLVTNNFHICRALALARGLGWENVTGVPVATTLLSLPHYLMREFCGVAYELVRGNLVF